MQSYISLMLYYPHSVIDNNDDDDDDDNELGSWRLVETTGDVQASSILFKRISVVVQRFNSVLLPDFLLVTS